MIPESAYRGAAVIDHGGYIDPVSVCIELRLSSGVIGMERDVKEAIGRI